MNRKGIVDPRCGQAGHSACAGPNTPGRSTRAVRHRREEDPLVENSTTWLNFPVPLRLGFLVRRSHLSRRATVAMSLAVVGRAGRR